jgi:hypothetical protein
MIVLGSVKYLSTIFVMLVLGLIAKCGGPAPVAQPKPSDPCQQGGVSYAPVGRIVRMEQVLLKEHRDYGTHVLLDASGNVQFVLQAPNLKLEPYSEDGKWYRVDGRQSPDHSDLFIVCAVSPSL